MSKVFLLILFLILSTHPVSGSQMESSRFRIDSESIDFTSPEKEKSVEKPPPKDEEAEEFESSGVLIRTDGQSTHSSPFRFMLEKSVLRMGSLTANTPAYASTRLTIGGGRSSYELTVIETEPLSKLSGETIPDTSCDPGKPCTPVIASFWRSKSAYGFGYSIKGDDIPEDFMHDNYFRPFPNYKKGVPAVVIMRGSDKTDDRKATLNLKTVVSAVQADGTYDTTLIFTAIPGY